MADPKHVSLRVASYAQLEPKALHQYLDYGVFALDLDERIMTNPHGRDVALRRREFDLLLTLARNPGRVMTRDALLDAIAGREAEAFDRTIDVYIGRLRRRIEKDPKHPQLIVTVPGVGYKLAVRPRTTQDARCGTSDRRSDEAAIREGFAILAAFNKANAERDAKAMSALYTAGAAMTKRGRLLHGRANIEEEYAHYYEKYRPRPSRLEHVAVIGNEIMLRVGRWSGTYLGEDGPVHRIGWWTTTDVREGDAWKIHLETIIPLSGSGGKASTGEARMSPMPDHEDCRGPGRDGASRSADDSAPTGQLTWHR